MTSLRCAVCSYIIDVQFLNDSTEKCPHCGETAAPRNVVTGQATEWPAERARRKAAAKAAKQGAEPVVEILAPWVQVPPPEPVTLPPVVITEDAPAPEPPVEETPPPVAPEPAPAPEPVDELAETKKRSRRR